MAAGLNDLLEKLQAIKISGSSSVDNLQTLVQSSNSGTSFLADKLQALLSTIQSGVSYVAAEIKNGLNAGYDTPIAGILYNLFPATQGKIPSQTGVNHYSLPDAGGSILSEYLIVERLKEHCLALWWYGTADTPTTGAMTVFARVYTTTASYLGRIKLCETSRLPNAVSDTFVYCWSNRVAGGVGDGFDPAGTLGPVGSPRIKLEFYVDATYDNGPIQVSALYFGAP